MARKNDGLTQRQRQSQQIMRDKAARKKRKFILHRVYFALGGVLCALALGGGLWAWKTGAAVRTAQTMVNGAYNLTARAGFSVQALYLEGRSRTSLAEIQKALDIKKGDPILRLSINDVRERLEKIESIKFAAVERALPGTLHVRIVERNPVAIWQHQGKLALVDDNGVIMNGLDVDPYRHLPLIVGDDAPKHVAELLDILSCAPELARRFAAAVRVGERRWNIRLNGNTGGDIEVKLPETEPAAAWKRLADLEVKQQILDRDVKMIDLRLPDRLFMKLPPQSPDKSADARET